MAKSKEQEITEVLDGLKALGGRAALLGLLPENGAKISQRGEFIIDGSNIEDDENKKMKTYRHVEFPKTLHAWPEDQPEPLTLGVKNRAEQDAAEAVGWSEKPLHGPAGRLDGDGKVQEPEAEPEVREFAPPGQPQPFEAGSQTGTKAKSARAPKVVKAEKPKRKSSR